MRRRPQQPASAAPSRRGPPLLAWQPLQPPRSLPRPPPSSSLLLHRRTGTDGPPSQGSAAADGDVLAMLARMRSRALDLAADGGGHDAMATVQPRFDLADAASPESKAWRAQRGGATGAGGFGQAGQIEIAAAVEAFRTPPPAACS